MYLPSPISDALIDPFRKKWWWCTCDTKVRWWWFLYRHFEIRIPFLKMSNKGPYISTNLYILLAGRFRQRNWKSYVCSWLFQKEIIYFQKESMRFLFLFRNFWIAEQVYILQIYFVCIKIQFLKVENRPRVGNWLIVVFELRP